MYFVHVSLFTMPQTLQLRGDGVDIQHHSTVGEEATGRERRERKDRQKLLLTSQLGVDNYQLHGIDLPHRNIIHVSSKLVLGSWYMV